jgi:simple sugar transport system substrate-binding protein
MAGEWAAETFADTPTKMVVLEGTTGSAPANDRAEGFDEAVEGTAIEKIDSQTGDFTRDGGKTVMEGFLQKYGVDGIDLVYAHNDDMALGAIEAIEAAGAEPGVDIQIVSIDAVKDGMQALVDGKINFIVECNPLLGELAAGLVTDVLAGKDVEKEVYVEDQTFTQEQAAEVIDSRPY